MSKKSAHYEEINFAVTHRMPHLQLSPTKSLLNRQCFEHFYPSAMAATTEIGYHSLQINSVLATFVIFFSLLFLSIAVLLVEIVSYRFSEKNGQDICHDLLIEVNKSRTKLLKFRNQEGMEKYLRRMDEYHLIVCAELSDCMY